MPVDDGRAPHEVEPSTPLRWWIPAAAVGAGVLLVAGVIGGYYALRATRDACVFASSTFPTPHGWKRIDHDTFRKGVVEGTIERIRVPRTKDPRARDTFYESWLWSEQRRVRSAEHATVARAVSLHGNEGSYTQFTYFDAHRRSISRVDHIMNPPEGGCGWHFRAAYRTSNDAPGERDAAHFPDDFSFAT
jgi:hypothetical protein